jgi:hypothetical protein
MNTVIRRPLNSAAGRDYSQGKAVNPYPRPGPRDRSPGAAGPPPKGFVPTTYDYQQACARARDLHQRAIRAREAARAAEQAAREAMTMVEYEYNAALDEERERERAGERLKASMEEIFEMIMRSGREMREAEQREKEQEAQEQ